MKIAIAMLATLTLFTSGCAKSSHDEGPQQLPITNDNVMGNWQLDTISANGMTFPANLQSAANENGYTASREIMQVEIDKSSLQIISSDEISVTSQIGADYRIEGSRIVTIDTPQLTVMDFAVVSLTAGTLSVQLPANGGPPMVANYNRIPDAALASQKLTPLPQKLSYELATPSLSHSAEQSDIYNGPLSQTSGSSLSCRYKKGNPATMTISMVSYARVADGMSFGAPNYSFEGPIAFNFRRPNDVLSFPASFSGNFKEDNSGKEISVRLSNKGSCDVQITRRNRALQVEGRCIGVDADGEEGSLKLDGNCVLGF